MLERNDLMLVRDTMKEMLEIVDCEDLVTDEMQYCIDLLEKELYEDTDA